MALAGAAAAVLAGLLVLPGTSRATSPTAICPADADPCLFPRGVTLEVDDGSVLDFGGRDFVMPPGSGTRLDIGAGTVVIRAASVTLSPGSGIVGAGGTLQIDTTGDVAVARDGNSRARIDVADDLTPGRITVTTVAGDVVVDGVIDARGKTFDAAFGLIDVDAGGSILVDGEMLATGAGLAPGGEVLLTAGGEITVSGILDVHGGDGGTISLDAVGRVVTTPGGSVSRLDARGEFGGGTGGAVEVSALDTVTIASPVLLQGEPSAFFGGDGGLLVIQAGRTLNLNADLSVFGTLPDGAGGEAEFSAGLDIVQTGTISAVGKPSYGLGGFVSYLARRTLVLGSVDVSADCDTCNGGEIDAQAWCALSLPASATLAAGGRGGAVLLEAGASLTIDGTILAGDSVDLLHHPDADAPDTSGAVIVPTPTITALPDVVPCGGPPGPTCGNGVFDEGEECDDGNQRSCDGCSGACQRETAGNGRIDCGEVCDDGNRTACDGCAADLSREDARCGDGIRECGEACDDGNLTPCDGCSQTCAIERCGNGRRECDEECDLGDEDNGAPDATCSLTCEALPGVACGDGALQPPETCDDGNLLDCDGCSALCDAERCGNNRRECDEECDDFNTDACDGCSPTCRLETCGNGIVDCGEECDDGAANGTPGSRCLPELCQIGTVCSSQPAGPCVPCLDDRDCDPAGQCGGIRCVTGVCELSPLDCDDDNPCTLDECDADAGCTHTLRPASEVPECTSPDACSLATCDAVLGCVVTPRDGFDGAECRLGLLLAAVEGAGLDAKTTKKLSKLAAKARARVAAAADGHARGRARKTKRGLVKGEKVLRKFSTRVERLTGARIPLATAAALLDAAAVAGDDLSRLRTSLGI